MKRVRLLLLLVLAGTVACAQQFTKIKIDTTATITGVNKKGAHLLGPQFSHEGSTLIADSADYSKDLNVFDAYGHVVIRQPNGTLIYADLLNYNGNTRVAILTDNVKLIDKDGVVLTTNSLTYNLATRVGRYTNGGKIVNKGDILTSKNGHYFDSTKDAYFRYDVVITTNEALVKADTMRYNTATRIAYFYGPTNIYGKEDTLYTELGNYNTDTRQANGYKNNLYQQDTKMLKGDSIVYDDIKGFGRANGNVVFIDLGPQQIMIFGQRGLYNRVDTSALMTKNPYLIFVTQDSAKLDSAYMTADTIFTKLIEKRHFKPVYLSRLILDADNSITEKSDDEIVAAVKRTKAALAKVVPVKPPPVKKPKKKKKGKDQPAEAPVPLNADSLKNTTSLDSIKTGIVLKRPKTAAQKADSVRRDSIVSDSIRFSKDTTKTRIVLSYHNVKIFKSDLQSTSDSAFYSYQDSVIRIYKDPVIWSQGAQLSADTIYIQLKDNKLDKMLLQRNGFIANTEKDSTNFNQVKGRTLTGYFRDSKLKKMYVNGSAESIYFVSDSTGYTGMNHSEGSVMRISFDNNEVSETAEIRLQNSTYTPYEQVKVKTLEGFKWRPAERPKSKEEIIPTLRTKKKVPPAKKTVPPAVKPKPVAVTKK